MQPSEMTNVQIADYILSLQSDVDGFPFDSNEIIREAAKRLLTDGDDDISKDAEIAELRDKIKVAEDALTNSPCGVIYQLGISDDDGNIYDGVVIKFDEAEALKMPRVRQGDKFRVLPLNALAAI